MSEAAAATVAERGFPVSETLGTAEKEKLLKELANLADESSRRDFLSQNRSLLRPEIVVEVSDHVREQVRVDVQQALHLAEIALIIAQELEDKESLARALRAKANVLYTRGENASAVDLHEQATALFEAVGKGNEAARTLSSSIQPLLLMGEYNQAFAAGDRARKIFEAEGNSWRLARLEINIGNIYYRQDRFGAWAVACRGTVSRTQLVGCA